MKKLAKIVRINFVRTLGINKKFAGIQEAFMHRKCLHLHLCLGNQRPMVQVKTAPPASLPEKCHYLTCLGFPRNPICKAVLTGPDPARPVCKDPLWWHLVVTLLPPAQFKRQLHKAILGNALVVTQYVSS